MLQDVVFALFGFALGIISLGIIIFSLRSKDEAMIQDLLDRITARTPGDYLSIIHFRNQHLKQKPQELFSKLKKKVGSVIPSFAEVEISQAKKEAAAAAVKEETDENHKHSLEFSAQQDLRIRQRRDTVLP